MKASNIKVVAAAVAAVLVFAGVAFAINIPGFGGKQSVKAANGAVAIPVAKVSDGKARFFKYASAGKEISFFIVKGGDGALHVALDACDACFREKKGYFHDGDAMVCRNCNKRFVVNRIGSANAAGGCNPAYLPFKTDGKNVMVKESDLAAAAKYF